MKVYEILFGKFQTKKILVFILLLIFLFSLTIKFAYVEVTKNWQGGSSPDTDDFLLASEEILEGNLFSSKEYDLIYYPLFPIYLSSLRVVFGDEFLLNSNRLGLRVASMIMYSVIAVMLALVGYWFWGLWGLVFVGVLSAVSPVMTFWSHYVLTESLFSFFLVLCLLSFLRRLKTTKSSSFYYFFGGMFFSLATLTRPMLLPFVVLLFLWVLMVSFSVESRRWKPLIFFTVIIISIFGLWQFRNWKATGANTFFPYAKVLSSFNNNMARQNILDPRYPEERRRFNTNKDFDAFMEHGNSIEILTLVLKTLGNKFKEFWAISLHGSSQSFSESKVIKWYVCYYSLVFYFLLSSLIFFRKNWKLASLLWFMVLYFTVVYVITLRGGGISARYRLPLEPAIYLLAAFGASEQLKFFLLRSKGLGKEK